MIFWKLFGKFTGENVTKFIHSFVGYFKWTECAECKTTTKNDGNNDHKDDNLPN